MDAFYRNSSILQQIFCTRWGLFFNGKMADDKNRYFFRGGGGKLRFFIEICTLKF